MSYSPMDSPASDEVALTSCTHKVVYGDEKICEATGATCAVAIAGALACACELGYQSAFAMLEGPQ